MSTKYTVYLYVDWEDEKSTWGGGGSSVPLTLVLFRKTARAFTVALSSSPAPTSLAAPQSTWSKAVLSGIRSSLRLWLQHRSDLNRADKSFVVWKYCKKQCCQHDVNDVAEEKDQIRCTTLQSCLSFISWTVWRKGSHVSLSHFALRLRRDASVEKRNGSQ